MIGGTISIFTKYFTTERSKFKKSVIWHQFRHFLMLLARINSVNYKKFRNESNTIHNDFQLLNNGNSLSELENINYQLDGDQFKNLADTYINRLKILFKENCDNYTDKNEVLKFFETLMRMCEIPIQYYNISHMRKQYQKYKKVLSQHFSFKDMKQFFYWTYKDSKSIKQISDNTQNKWTLLKKYLLNSFLKY